MSIFRDTFTPGVQNQLTIRQNGIAARTPAAIQYYNARNAWVRMSSAVNVGGSNELAKKYILQGGILHQGNLRAGVGTGNEAYSLNSPNGVANRLGIRPMPGIIDIDIQSKGSYGSLRTVTVNFVAWDLRQLEDLELLYMRPGYTALIEWGWAPYLDNSGNLVSANNIPFYDIINNTPSKEKIYIDLFGKAAETGNYDAMYGKVQNYSWKARVDGGYDCTTTIISIGEVIDSLKVNYAPFHIPEVETKGIIASRIPGLPSVQNEISGSYSQNIIAGLCSELYAIVKQKGTVNETWPLKDGNNVYVFYKAPIKVSNGEATKTSITKSGDQIYITLESFVAIMNKYVLLQVPGNLPYVKLSVNASTITAKGEPLLCLGDKIQLSTNPSVCLIANNAWLKPEDNLGMKGYTASNTLTKFINAALGSNKGYFYTNDFDKLQYGVIGNIFVNLDYIYSIVTDDNTASQDKKEKNDISLYTFIKTLMSGINTAIGNVANFDVHVDPTDGNIARIIDVNYVDTATRGDAYKKAFMFEMQKTGPDKGSILRNYSFESQIFPEQSATVAIASQVEAGALGSGDNTLVDFYQNLTDRIIPVKKAPSGASETAVAANEAEQAKSALQTYQQNLETLTSYIDELDSTVIPVIDIQVKDGTFDISKASAYSNALKDIINYFKSLESGNNKNRGIIPTKLSFEIDGIGGIVIGNMFRIPDEILPRGYRGDGAGPAKIGFLVTQLGHSIQNNDWITKINSQFVILDDPRGQKISNNARKAITRNVTSGNLNKAANIVNEVQLLTSQPGPAAKDIPPEVTVDKVIAAMQRKGYSFYANTDYGRNKLNIVGVRAADKAIGSAATNYFTDFMVMFYFDDNKKRVERIGWLTTAPGLTFEAKEFGGPGGKPPVYNRTIMMQEGQYVDAYQRGLHRGKPALVQVGTMNYFKDTTLVEKDAKTGKLVAKYSSVAIVSGKGFATNIHSSGKNNGTLSTKQINDWSAGCQVFRSYDDHLWMLQAAANQVEKTNYKSFTYTMLNISDLK